MLKISITFNLSIGILGVCAERDIYAHISIVTVTLFIIGKNKDLLRTTNRGKHAPNQDKFFLSLWCKNLKNEVDFFIFA